MGPKEKKSFLGEEKNFFPRGVFQANSRILENLKSAPPL